ncbi:MAG: hypothetical protein J7M18_01990, partial [Candidatus Eremiobacteraeota bacterium]|nr:hypothetical protein [Candidatus Eremiobacteraeota bacterium]
GVTFSFIFAGHISSFPIMAIVLGFMWLSVLTLRKTGIFQAISLALLFILILLFSPVMEKKTEMIRWKGLAGDLPLIESLDSRYQYLTLTKQAEQWSLYNNGQYSFSFPDPYRDRIIASMVMTQHPDPREILIVGDASPDFIEEFLKWPVSHLDWVFLDNKLLNAMSPAMNEKRKKILENKRLKLRFLDGRFWVAGIENKYDLIWMNVPQPTTALLNRYYTSEFYQMAKKALKNDGTLAMFYPSAENYMAGEVGELTHILYATLKKIFPYIAIAPGEGTYVFASDSPGIVTENPEILKNRYTEKIKKSTFFSPILFKQLYLPERIKYYREMLSKRAMINTDQRPISYFMELVIWLRLTGESSADLLSGIHRTGRYWVMVGIILFFVMIFILWAQSEKKKATGKYSSPFLLPATTAAAIGGMGLELILVFSYQNIFGYLYQMIGLIFACFMFGLAIGSLVASRLGGDAGRLAFRMVLTGILILSAFTPEILQLVSGLNSEFLFFIFVLICGGLVGMVLPLAIEEGHQSGIILDRQAGKVNMADHLGGALGAYIYGVFLIPLLGLSGSCIVLVFLILIPLLGLDPVQYKINRHQK